MAHEIRASGGLGVAVVLAGLGAGGRGVLGSEGFHFVDDGGAEFGGGDGVADGLRRNRGDEYGQHQGGEDHDHEAVGAAEGSESFGSNGHEMPLAVEIVDTHRRLLRKDPTRANRREAVQRRSGSSSEAIGGGRRAAEPRGLSAPDVMLRLGTAMSNKFIS
jgi:hypothetical protein